MTRLFTHGPAAAGLVLLVLMAGACAAAGWIGQVAGTDAETIDLVSRLAPSSPHHPLGTDELGRDFLQRLLRGGQVSLAVGVATALFAATIGTVIGLVAGSVGGLADALLMRLTDAVIALPLLPLLIVLGALDPAKLGLPLALVRAEWVAVARVVVIIGLVGWTTVARLVRAQALIVNRQDYVRAAQALGASRSRIMWRHVLPNVTTPMIVATTLSVGNIILLESGLSFLGLGVQPPLPSWGNMLTAALDQIYDTPSLALWPGLMIFLAVLAFNLVGDGLRDTLSPHRAIH
jgi:peptide/nickel transport system permease protein